MSIDLTLLDQHNLTSPATQTIPGAERGVRPCLLRAHLITSERVEFRCTKVKLVPTLDSLSNVY